MSRNPANIIQIPAPTDGSLKRFVSELLQTGTVTRVAVTVAGLPATNIDGAIETASADDSSDAVEERTWDKVREEVEDAFSSTNELALSVMRISFIRGGSQICNFERVRTVPQLPVQHNRSTVQYFPVPDARVAELTYATQDSSLGPFTELMNKHLRPAVGTENANLSIAGFDDVLSRMAGVSASLMDDLGKAQLRQSDRMDELLEQQRELHGTTITTSSRTWGAPCGAI